MIKEKIIKEEVYWKIPTLEELDTFVQEGGWRNVEDFFEDTGTCWTDIQGKWFTVLMGRVFIA